MQRAMEVHPVENYDPFELEVTLPGNLRRIVTGFQQPNLVIPASMGKPPVAELKPHPALIFEIDPSKPKSKRRFIWLPSNTKLNYEGKLKFLDSYIDESTGEPVFLYEVVAE